MASALPAAVDGLVHLENGTEEVEFYWNQRMCVGTELHNAALEGDNSAVADLIDKGAQVSQRFHHAILKDGTNRVQTGEALHLAASRGHVEVVNTLLERHANLDSAVERGGQYYYDALHAAVFGEGRRHLEHVKRADMVQYLLRRSMDPMKGNSQGETALHFAFQLGCTDVIHKIWDRLELSETSRLTFWRSSSRMDQKQLWLSALEAGVKSSVMQRNELADLAPLCAEAMQLFLQWEPRCLERFLKRRKPSVHKRWKHEFVE